MTLVILSVAFLLLVVAVVFLGGWVRVLQTSIDLTHAELHAHANAEDPHGSYECAKGYTDGLVEPQIRRVHISLDSLSDIVAAHDGDWSLLADDVKARVTAISEDHARLHGEIDNLQTEVRSALAHVQSANIALREYQSGNLTELLDQVTDVENRLRPVIQSQAYLEGEIKSLHVSMDKVMSSTAKAVDRATADLRNAHREDLATIDATLSQLTASLDTVTRAQVRMDTINESLRVLTTRVENGVGKRQLRIP